MHLSRNAVLSCQILAAHKLRTLLSLTGVVVGVGAVILMVSVGKGAEKRILDRIRSMGTDLIIVNAAPARLMIGRQRTVATVTTLTPADARAIAEECAGVVATAPAVNKSLVVRWEGNNTTTTVTGIAWPFTSVRMNRPASVTCTSKPSTWMVGWGGGGSPPSGPSPFGGANADTKG